MKRRIWFLLGALAGLAFAGTQPLRATPFRPLMRSPTGNGVYLNPGTGRFWTMDSEAGDVEAPLSLHRYLYGASSPVSNTDPTGRAAEEALTSIGAGAFVTSMNLPTIAWLTTSYRFKGCSILQVMMIQEALPEARAYAQQGRDATQMLLSAYSKAFRQWFGRSDNHNEDQELVAHVTGNFLRIFLSLDKAQYCFVCNKAQYFKPWATSYYGSTTPLSEHWIRLGPAFFDAPLTGQDSRAGTLIHEVSHLVGGTADYAYEVPNAYKLAQTRPQKAIRNADNYEYFVEIGQMGP